MTMKNVYIQPSTELLTLMSAIGTLTSVSGGTLAGTKENNNVGEPLVKAETGR